MSQVNTVGRVTADFELQMSANNVPYVRFSLVENIGIRRIQNNRKYLQVWAYGEDAARLAKSKAKKREPALDQRRIGTGRVPAS